MTPFTSPTKAPTASTRSTATMPRSLSFIPLSTVIDRITAARVSTPSTDRSIEPIRMMKVSPMPRTSGIAASWLIRTKFPKLRKFRLMEATMTHSRTRTIAGAHAATRQRRFAREGALGGGAKFRDAVREATFRRVYRSLARALLLLGGGVGVTTRSDMQPLTRGANRSRLSCPRKRASRLGRSCGGPGFPLSRE